MSRPKIENPGRMGGTNSEPSGAQCFGPAKVSSKGLMTVEKMLAKSLQTPPDLAW